MASERKEDLKNMKVLTSKATGTTYYSKKESRTVTEYEVVLQSEDEPGNVQTGVIADPAPEVGTTLEKVIVYEDNFQGKIKTKFLIPTAQGSGESSGGGSSSKSYAPAPKESEEAKIVGIFGSYVLQGMMAAPDPINWETYSDTVDQVAVAAWQTVKTLKA